LSTNLLQLLQKSPRVGGGSLREAQEGSQLMRWDKKRKVRDMQDRQQLDRLRVAGMRLRQAQIGADSAACEAKDSGLSWERIADALGVAPNTAKSWAGRGVRVRMRGPSDA
jgi:photosystem II stability/assembly factor-like uncharacterized protein